MSKLNNFEEISDEEEGRCDDRIRERVEDFTSLLRRAINLTSNIDQKSAFIRRFISANIIDDIHSLKKEAEMQIPLLKQFIEGDNSLLSQWWQEKSAGLKERNRRLEDRISQLKRENEEGKEQGFVDQSLLANEENYWTANNGNSPHSSLSCKSQSAYHTSAKTRNELNSSEAKEESTGNLATSPPLWSTPKRSGSNQWIKEVPRLQIQTPKVEVDLPTHNNSSSGKLPQLSPQDGPLLQWSFLSVGHLALSLVGFYAVIRYTIIRIRCLFKVRDKKNS